MHVIISWDINIKQNGIKLNIIIIFAFLNSIDDLSQQICMLQRHIIHFNKNPHALSIKVRKWAKIRNRYNQAPHLTQDTNGKVTTSQLDFTNASQEVSNFPAGDHKASISRCAQKHNKTNSEIT